MCVASGSFAGREVWNLQLLTWLNAIRVAEYVAVRIEDLLIAELSPGDLLGNSRKSVASLHFVLAVDVLANSRQIQTQVASTQVGSISFTLSQIWFVT